MTHFFNPSRPFKIRLMIAFLEASTQDVNTRALYLAVAQNGKPNVPLEHGSFSVPEKAFRIQLIAFIQQLKAFAEYARRGGQTPAKGRSYQFPLPAYREEDVLFSEIRNDTARLIHRIRNDHKFCRTLMYAYAKVALEKIEGPKNRLAQVVEFPSHLERRAK
ncbi:MAG TPA: hypothetical protein PLK94_08920 [Alphaproteobacteria bacterium]|nr:hypothetical protein [Alphaproteobacteria bacterium]HOO51393.1 hypothetical protein [Alphaproteobacteria bacterium]